MSTLEMEMPQSVSPNTVNLPEIGEHGDALRELYTLSDEMVAELRPQLWDAAEKVASQVIDPAQQKAVALYAAAADWHLFGKPGDPMPDGLVVAVAEKGAQDIRLDSRIPWFNYSVHYLDTRLRQVGFSNVIHKVLDEVEQRGDQIKGVIEAVMRNSAEYQLLASFDQPLSKPDSSLLTPFWRRIREGQIEHDVKRRYGLESVRPIPTGTDAARDYTRQLYHLDSETMVQPQQPKSQHEAVLRARNYLNGYVKQAFEDREDNGEFSDVYYDEGNGVSIRDVNFEDEDDGQEFYDYASKAAATLSDEIYIGSPELQEFTEMFLDYAILKIMDPRTGGNLSVVLDEAIKEAVDHIQYNLRDGIAPDFQGFGSGYAMRDTTIFLRGENGEHVKGSMLLERIMQRNSPFNWEPFMRGQSQISSYSELMRDKQTRLARIDAYGPQNFRVSSRLLLEGSADVEVPKEVAPEDLVVAIDGMYAHNDLIPMIPGYRLASKRGFASKHRYGFVVSPEGDPYRECSVIINEKRRGSLFEAYASLGLHELAEKVKDTSRLTVAQLTSFIRGESIYFLPDAVEGRWEVSSTGDGPLNRRLAYKDTLEDFGSSVNNGKLYVQCSGAAHFLRYSLERAFGKGSAGFAGGYVIHDTSSEVSMAQHAQTVFAHKGKQYLLDATPAANLGSHDLPLKEANGRAHRQNAAKAPQMDQASHTDANHSEVVIYNREKPLDEDVEEQIQSLTKRLMVVFDTPNEDTLFKELVRLPRHDPARKTYELLVQFGNGTLSDDDALSVVDYIQNCANATPEDRRKVGIDHYSNELLQQLESTAWHLKWAIEKARKAEQ